MIRFLAFFAISVTAWGASILDPNFVNPSLFNVGVLASGLALPTDVTIQSDGSVLVSTSPNYGGSQGQLLYFGTNGTPGTSVYSSSFQGAPQNGLLTGTAALGSDLAVGTFELGAGQNTINILQPGATSSSPQTILASLQMTYSNAPWDHDTVGMAARPTPGVPGSYDLILNVGSELDATATPPGDTVALTGAGFSSAPNATLQGDSLYMVQINTNGAQPAVTSVTQVATGIRNVYGMAFDSAGDLYFTNNAADGNVSGPPPAADTLDMIPAGQLGVGPPQNFGFPNCYVQYAYGGTPGTNVGAGCVLPVMAFQPLTENGVQQEMLAPTDLAFAPANFPAPYNDGIFIGFTGGARPGEEAGVVFYSFATGTDINFVNSAYAPVDNILGVTSTANDLYLSDFGAGIVYDITAAAPEPKSGLLAGMTCLAGILLIGLRARRAQSAARIED